jgi:hypothetical protein
MPLSYKALGGGYSECPRPLRWKRNGKHMLEVRSWP